MAPLQSNKILTKTVGDSKAVITVMLWLWGNCDLYSFPFKSQTFFSPVLQKSLKPFVPVSRAISTYHTLEVKSM